MKTPKSVLITGVSSGIGLALAKEYLTAGCQVWGTSRRTPEELMEYDHFRFVSMDLSRPDSIRKAIDGWLDEQRALDLVILNAGRLGVFGDLINAELEDLQQTMLVNVWANKILLDCLFDQPVSLSQVVLISSGAAVNGNRGWSGYSISKAALNMLTKLYAKERPETHFTALAPGIVDTAIQDELLEREPDDRFPSVEVLRSKRNSPDMPTPNNAAPLLMDAMARLPDLVESGDFADVRKPPLATS
ncbi:MAG: SDR family NAD(P)-dependent oxidoreductase [Planctomycetaceae bacterium]|nr:SDR family NAD(P)-dependent oxidoreductase [Planctomycetaceae bacterium]